MSASLRQQLKPWVRAIGNRLRFPKAQIGTSSYISDGCHLDPGIVIGNHCHVFQSKLAGSTVLGDEVVVGHLSTIATTILGRGCVVERQVELFNCSLANYVAVQTGCELTKTQIGRYSYVGRETNLNEVSVGSFSSIGPRTLLGCGEHPSNLISTAPLFYSTRRQCGIAFAAKDHFEERKPITLGHDVWLGAHVFVRDGVTIGDGAIVAAGSVVTKDVPPYAIVGGVPAKIIRTRFAESEIARLLAVRWWDWDETRLRANQPWFAQSDIAKFLEKAKA